MEKKSKSMGKSVGGLSRHGHGQSFHGSPSGRSSAEAAALKKAASMRRPRTHPELLDRAKPAAERTPWLNLETKSASPAKGCTKLLVNVTVAQSIGALRVLVSDDATVLDVVKAALALYAKEGRRPVLCSDPSSFGLHYSQFSIDCLDPKHKIKDLGSRNFFLCPKAKESCASVASCGSEVEKISRSRDPWYKLIDCFLML